MKTRLGIGLNVPKTGLEIDATLLLSLIPFQYFLSLFFLSSYSIVIIFSLALFLYYLLLMVRVPEVAIQLRKGTGATAYDSTKALRYY